MAHIHSVFDSNEHFVIDPLTRAIANSLSKKIVVMQYDHNSERFTFEIPKVDGHIMANCDRVEIHYINVDALDKTLKSTGVYEVNDIQLSPDDNSVAVFSWLLSRNCTKYAGTLSFLIHFACTTNGVEDYAWNTAIFQSITIGNGMNNGEEVVEPYADIIAQWKADLFGVGDTEEQRLLTVSAEQQAAIAAKGAAVLDSIPDEYEALQAQADENTRTKAVAIVLDAEGESIVVNDASEYPLQYLKLFGKSTQDGTPTPDAPVDIVSIENPTVDIYSGNLLKDNAGYKKTYNGLTCEYEGDGIYHFYGTYSGTNPSMQFADMGLNLPVDPNASYTLSAQLIEGIPPDDFHPYIGIASDAVSHRNWMAVSIENATKIGEIRSTTQVPADAIANPTTINKFWIYAYNDTLEQYTADFRFRVWLTKSDAPMPYEPYNKQSFTMNHSLPGVPVSSGGNYTDENGQQWICDEVDLARGVYVQRIGNKVFDGSDDEIWHFDSLVLDNTIMFRMEIRDSVNVGNVVGLDFLCTHFEAKNMYNADTTGLQHTMQQFYFRLPKTVLTSEDVIGFRTLLAVSPMTVGYVLKTPIETPLSDAEINAFKALHSNKPNTTVLNDAGAFMAVEYVADTKTYIDNKIKELVEGVTA